MPKRLTVLFLALLFAPLAAGARGGGGIEYLTSIGPDLIGVVFPDSPLLVLPTGSVEGISGFGYGITRGGWKIGGFGTFFFTLPLSVPFEALDGKLTGAAGGFGGVISGGHARWRPFTLGLNTRLGVGGLGVAYTTHNSWGDGSPIYVTTGTFAIFGAADAEIGLLFVPAMMISVFAGVDALVAISYGSVIPAAVPTMGLRITWGRF